MPRRFRIQAPHLVRDLVSSLALRGEFDPHLIEDVTPVVLAGGELTSQFKLLGEDGTSLAAVDPEGAVKVAGGFQLLGREPTNSAVVDETGALLVNDSSAAPSREWQAAVSNPKDVTVSGESNVQLNLPAVRTPCAVRGIAVVHKQPIVMAQNRGAAVILDKGGQERDVIVSRVMPTGTSSTTSLPVVTTINYSGGSWRSVGWEDVTPPEGVVLATGDSLRIIFTPTARQAGSLVTTMFYRSLG